MTRRKTPPFLKTIQKTILENNMCPAGAKVLVAHSAGADSTALLHVLHRLSKPLGICLAAAHLHHGIRKESARRDQMASEAAARALGIPFFTETVDTPKVAREKKIGTEEAARELRHAFLQRSAKAFGAHRIATGHHEDDVAEQLLLNLLRGAGLGGLSAMGPQAPGGIIRPLVHVSRKQIHNWLKKEKILFCTDETNNQTEYTRNRVRHTLLPLLEKGFNPSASRTLARTARILRQDEAWLKEMSRQLFAACTLGETQKSVSFDLPSLLAQHPAARARIFRQAAEKLSGSKKGLTQAHLENIDTLLIKNTEGKRIDLTRGFRATIEEGALVFERHPQNLRHLPPLTPPETFALEIERVGDHEERLLCLPFAGQTLQLAWGEAKKSPQKKECHIALDSRKIHWPLTLRTLRPGDRFRPQGGVGSRKVVRFLNDCGVKGQKKERALLLEDALGILWVVGLRPDERGSAPPAGERALHVTLLFKNGKKGQKTLKTPSNMPCLNAKDD